MRENGGGESGTQKLPAPSRNTDPYEGSTPEEFDAYKYVPFLLDFIDHDV